MILNKVINISSTTAVVFIKGLVLILFDICIPFVDFGFIAKAIITTRYILDIALPKELIKNFDRVWSILYIALLLYGAAVLKECAPFSFQGQKIVI
jgi:hypothetical protein